MSKNLKELVLHQIYDVITNKKYAPLITTLKDSNPCASCPNYKQAKATGTQLICNCTLGLPNILA